MRRIELVAGDDPGESAATTTATVVARNPDRYCALTRELDAEGEAFFADLGQDATEAQSSAAEERIRAYEKRTCTA